MIKIHIETIPHADQRYPTCGDYWVDADGVMQIRISDMNNWRYELLVALHELVEQSLCLHRGIPEVDITKFDIEHPELEEPGMDKRAPYHAEHIYATRIELDMADQLRVSWKEYDDKVQSL